MKNYTIPVIPGDGIGPEVIAEGRKVLDRAAALHNFAIEWKEFSLGADHYLKTGELVSPETLKALGAHKALYFGAVGDERVPPGILEKGIILALRYHFDQYINLRPTRVFPNVKTPVRFKENAQVDFVIVRENTEDFYIDTGGHAPKGNSSSSLHVHRALYDFTLEAKIQSSSEQIAFQLGLASREGLRRVLRYSFELAQKRRKKLAMVDKANVITHIYGFWRDEFALMSREFPDIQTEVYYADALAALLVLQPEHYDVIVAPNLFGDILSDLGAAVAGSMGLAAGANLNPHGTSMFEPVHGTAPTLRGLHRANPIATIWAGALMLDFLGEPAAANSVMRAIEQSLAESRVRTPDLGGSSTTQQLGDEISQLLKP